MRTNPECLDAKRARSKCSKCHNPLGTIGHGSQTPCGCWLLLCDSCADSPDKWAEGIALRHSSVHEEGSASGCRDCLCTGTPLGLVKAKAAREAFDQSLEESALNPEHEVVFRSGYIPELVRKGVIKGSMQVYNGKTWWHDRERDAWAVRRGAWD